MLFKSSLFFILVSFLIKLIAIFYTNFDFFGDEAQYWIWSQNLDLGYYSKPPLLSWIIGIVTMIFGNDFEVLKLIPVFMYLLSTYVVYLLSYQLFKKKNLAVVTSLSFYLIPSVSISSFLISTDVILIFFWSLSLIFLLKIRKEPKFIYFLLLGIFLGLSFLAKYAAIYFIFSLILIIIFDNTMKKAFFKNKNCFIIFFLSLLFTLSPNIIWNINNDWITISHTSENAGLQKINFNIPGFIEFILAQIVMIGPILFLFLFLFFKKIVFNFETKFLLIFSLPIFFVVMIESLLVKANANWAAVAFITFFIFTFKVVYDYSKKILIINNLVNFLFCISLYGLITISYPLKVFDRISGVSNFTEILKESHLTETKYLVVEDRLMYSSLKYSLKDQPIIILMPHSPGDEIKSHFQLANPLNPNFLESFIFIGNPQALKYLKNDNLIKKIDSYFYSFKTNSIDIYEVAF